MLVLLNIASHGPYNSVIKKIKQKDRMTSSENLFSYIKQSVEISWKLCPPQWWFSKWIRPVSQYLEIHRPIRLSVKIVENSFTENRFQIAKLRMEFGEWKVDFIWRGGFIYHQDILKTLFFHALDTEKIWNLIKLITLMHLIRVFSVCAWAYPIVNFMNELTFFISPFLQISLYPSW